MVERSQNTVLLASTQAVYKAPQSTVQGLTQCTHTESHTHAVLAVGSLRA